MKTASLVTDGSCLGNPGPGGWACILRFGAVKKELFGYDPNTTNNRDDLELDKRPRQPPGQQSVRLDCPECRPDPEQFLGRWQTVWEPSA